MPGPLQLQDIYRFDIPVPLDNTRIADCLKYLIDSKKMDADEGNIPQQILAPLGNCTNVGEHKTYLKRQTPTEKRSSSTDLDEKISNAVVRGGVVKLMADDVKGCIEKMFRSEMSII